MVKRATDAAVFDAQFDQYLSKHASYFPEVTNTLRKSQAITQIQDPTEKSNLLAATAAKEFFGVAANLEILDPTDRAWVEANVNKVAFENQIDGLQAWGYIEKAMYNHNLIRKRAGDNGDTTFDVDGNFVTGYAALDKYNKEHLPEHMRDFSDQY